MLSFSSDTGLPSFCHSFIALPITYVVGIQRRSLLFRRVKSLLLLYLCTMVLFCKGQSVDAEMQGILSLMPWTFHQTIRSWYTGHWWVGCYIWYSEEEGTGRAAAPPSPLLAVPNVTAHPSTASVPITVLLYDGPLLCGFNVAIKGLRCWPPTQDQARRLRLWVCLYRLPESTPTIAIYYYSARKLILILPWHRG